MGLAKDKDGRARGRASIGKIKKQQTVSERAVAFLTDGPKKSKTNPERPFGPNTNCIEMDDGKTYVYVKVGVRFLDGADGTRYWEVDGSSKKAIAEANGELIQMVKDGEFDRGLKKIAKAESVARKAMVAAHKKRAA